ncbi:MAG: hypothetical protein ACM3KM_01865 [Acidobacteriaceae bacterium]
MHGRRPQRLVVWFVLALGVWLFWSHTGKQVEQMGFKDFFLTTIGIVLFLTSMQALKGSKTT